jgi:processive 1,2-diacylglycerol beta-glucosyltransferase
MAKKRILMTMAEAGSGHKAPAMAVRDALEERHPGRFDVEVVDLGPVAGAHKSDRHIKNAWDAALAHPMLGRVGYRMIESLHPVSRLYPRLVMKDYFDKGAQYIASYAPDLVFSTYTFTTTAATLARDWYDLSFRVILYVTDPFDAYSWWAEKQADYLLVASEQAGERLQERGIDAAQIRYFDFPINNRFLSVSAPADELRQRYGLDPGYCTILATDGGRGIGNVGAYMHEVYRRGMPFNIILVCARNEQLLAESRALIQNEPSDTVLVPVGYVDNMNELLSISDLMVAKAGASTTFEALLMGVPIVFSCWASYNEKPNVDFVLDNDIGWYAPDEESVMALMERVCDTDVIHVYKENIRQLGLHSGSNDIADFVASLLAEQPAGV